MLAPSTPSHSDISEYISTRWIEYLSSQQENSVDISTIHEEFEAFINPYDDKATVLFTHPVWTIVRKHTPNQTTCLHHIAEYYLWLLNNPYLNHLSIDERLTTFWATIFPRISPKEVELWVLQNHSQITNL